MENNIKYLTAKLNSEMTNIWHDNKIIMWQDNFINEDFYNNEMVERQTLQKVETYVQQFIVAKSKKARVPTTQTTKEIKSSSNAIFLDQQECIWIYPPSQVSQYKPFNLTPAKILMYFRYYLIILYKWAEFLCSATSNLEVVWEFLVWKKYQGSIRRRFCHTSYWSGMKLHSWKFPFCHWCIFCPTNYAV